MAVSLCTSLTRTFDRPLISIPGKRTRANSKVRSQDEGNMLTEQVNAAASPAPWQISADIGKPKLLSSTSRVTPPRAAGASASYSDNFDLLEDCTNEGAPISSREPFWKKIPVFEHISEDEFLNYKWQLANTLRKEEEIVKFLESVIPYDYKSRDDILEGMRTSPMSVSLTPYVLSCMDWTNVSQDPLRKQFLPMHSQRLPDHPMLEFDSLAEQSDSPTPGIVHRYPNKALFLATSVCPIYCRFCTRSYSVGEETQVLQKHHFTPNKARWQNCFNYITSSPKIEDVLVSGGDTFFLTPEDIEIIGSKLLSTPHIRRIRFATRGLTAAPMRFLSDKKWTNALLNVVKEGRRQGKQVSIQVHFNHPNEITWVTELVALRLFSLGITLRNQSPLLKGINDSVSTMSNLIHKIANLNIQPYYVFQGDMVKGVEDLRTPLSSILHLERHIQGTISGYYTPKFMVDLPSGGGKRLACSFDYYDPVKGISQFTAPGVKDGLKFLYYDPLHALPVEIQQNWLQGRMP